MIGTDDMSSSGMDISESFRPEDISKTDFFDFVTAPDMGIGLGVNVNLHHAHHNHHHHNHLTQQQHQQQHHHHHHNHHHLQHQGGHPQQQQHHHAQQSHHTTESSNTKHDGGSGGGGGAGSATGAGDSHGSDGSSASTADPTLQSYEFWASDKEHTSTIFEDLDRYCWHQQPSTTSTPSGASASNANTNSNNNSANQMHHTSSPATNSLNPIHSSLANPTSPHTQNSPVVTPATTTTPNPPVAQTQLNSDGSISNIISTDGQIYTLTVLNGNEPWLKREADAHLQSTLDLDSLLGTFPGYIKSEYPYEDSGFSTDGCKDLSGENASIIGNNSQRLPSLINTIPSVTSSGNGAPNDASVGSLTLGQLDQFHNNNNDWHMTDHNNEQNSAESLLRSALQGKGYAKGIQMHNGLTLMPSSPSVKDEDMRRILFPVDTDGLNFSDTSLSAAQIFDDTQTANGHNPHMIVPRSPLTNGPLTPVTNAANGGSNGIGGSHNSNQASGMMVDDMFLTLENAFSDDFEKIKQFCSTTSANEFSGNDVMMQISPDGTGGNQAASQQLTTLAVTTSQQQQQQQQQLQALHATSTTTTTSTPNSASGALLTNQLQQQQVPPPPPPQPLKPEVTTSNQRLRTTTKVTKKYKRSLTTHNNNNNNNNTNNNQNTNVNNHSSTTTYSSHTKAGGGGGGGVNLPLANGTRNGSVSSGSSTTSSNSPPHCNGIGGTGSGGGGVGGNSSSTTSASSTAGGQRKERSLHYCSICAKGFKDKYSVNVHIRTHTGEKPFACTLCGKSFRQKAHLAKHYQTHMAQKNHGGLVKNSNSNKHHRSSAAAPAQQQQQQQQQQHLNSSAIGHNHSRQLTMATGALTTPTIVSHSVGIVNSILTATTGLTLGATSAGSTTPTAPATILPPANGLLANR